MALSQTTVIERLRVLAATVTGIEAAYAPTAVEAAIGGIPPSAAFTFPCAIVLPGPSSQYLIGNGRHRHTYRVRVLILVAGVDVVENAYVAAPMPDRFIEVMTGNVTAGGRANSVVFVESSGMAGVSWGGLEYLGYELTLEVSETAAATPAAGS